MHKNIKLKNPLCIAFPVLEPCPPCPSICDVVCNKICGNILLNNQVLNLEIWKEEIIGEATVSVSVFNSAISSSSIEVIVIRNIGSPVELVIPPGNTLSTTVNNVRSVIVSHEDIGIIEGKYCLDVCFAISC
ncbi:hypothetical protein EXW34_31415 (plasmid) [Bacillus mycoides]|uniref:S-Ena type endospore appendage n=1 Tax=Bacillus mycoides TaxID=1405 RepID=UPI001C02D5C5|nr:S-Ena type endospore appendage [Bacillus mycoides]QWI25680.1 hypothetical protein EXW34_31415 [Bacillus mycoides]